MGAVRAVYSAAEREGRENRDASPAISLSGRLARTRAWEIEEPRIVQNLRWWHDGVPGAKINLQRNPNVSQRRQQRDAHSSTNTRLRDSGDVSPKPSRSMPFGRSNRFAEPQQEQSCALEDEAAGELRLRQATQQALTAEPRERELVFDAELAASFNESRLPTRQSWDPYASQDDRFEVGLHHPLNAKLLRSSIQVIQLDAFGAPPLGQRFERNVEANPVPESKAIRNRAGEAVHANCLPLNAMLLDAKVEHGRRDVDCSKRRRREARHTRAAWHSNPDLGRELRAYVV